MPTHSCRIIRDEAEFQSIVDDWNRLAHLTDPKSVFLRHEWSDAAWQWLKADGCNLQIVCVYRDNRLTGICPFVSRRIKSTGMGLLELSGLAVPDTQEFSIIADPSDLPDVISAVMGLLQSDDLRWDMINLQKLPEDLAATKSLVAAVTDSGFVTQQLQCAANPGIRLDGTWEAYYARRSRRLKKGNNLVRNRLERDGKEVDIKCFDGTTDEDSLDTLLDTLTHLSARSWKASTGLTLDCPGPGAFLAKLGSHASANGWLLVWLMFIDSRPAAMELQLQYNGVVSGLRADFDDQFGDYSPGTLLNWRIIENLFSRDADYYALGPGSNPYKARWVEERRDLTDLIVYGDSLRARCVGFIENQLKPLARKIRDSLARKSDS